MATYYVSPTGTNSGPGTSPSAPWLTIQYAITNSTTGDTIVMAAGTYTQSANLTLSARTYRGAGNDSTIIDFGGGSYQLVLNGTIITAQDLRIANITRTDEEYCIVNQVTSAAVSFSRVWFEALVCGISRSVIGTDQAFGQTPGVFTLISCLFTKCAKRTSGGMSSFFGSGNNTSSVTAINCVIYDDATAAVGLSMVSGQGSSNQLFAFKNCILYSTNTTTFVVAGTQLYTGSAANCIVGWSSVPAGVNATITADPLFVDAASGNFNLRPTSSARNAGTLV